MRVLQAASFLRTACALARQPLILPQIAGDIQLEMDALKDGPDCLGGWHAINPSLAPIPGSDDIAVAMRHLCMQQDGLHARWYNELIVGVAPSSDLQESRGRFHWKSLEIAPDPRQLSERRRECQLPGLDEAHGPEDPRLVEAEEGLYAIVTGYDVQDVGTEGWAEENGTQVCGEHGVLLYAAEVKSLSPPEFGNPVQLTFEGMGQVEKNWAMFREGSRVLGVYGVDPHRIVELNLKKGTVEFIAHTESDALKALADSLGADPADFHGGAGVALVSGGEGDDYYLSVLHTTLTLEGGGRVYVNFPYKFSTQHPYEITSIGKRLPLVLQQNPHYGEWVAFVTTVMFEHGDVLIGYGSGDTSSRTRRVPLDAFEARYFAGVSPAEVAAEVLHDGHPEHHGRDARVH